MVALAWGALAALAILLALAVPASALRDGQIVVLERVRLGALAVVSLAPAAAVAGVLLQGTLIRSRPGGVARGAIALVQVVSWVGLYLVYFLYLASWASFASIGQFLDSSAIAFWIASPVQLTQHAVQLAPAMAALGPIVPVLLVAATIWCARALASRSELVQRRFTLDVSALVLVAAVVALPFWGRFGTRSNMPYDTSSGLFIPGAEALRTARAERTSPILRIIYERVERGAQAGVPAVAVTVPIDTEPLLSTAGYLDRVSPGWKRRNVLLIVVESLRNDQLVAYGGERSAMPAVDALARGARVYTGSIANATHSNYASVVPVSGMYPLRSVGQYIYPKRIPFPRVLLYDLLHPLGYRTAIFSSQNETWGGMYNFLDSGSLDRFFHSETYRGTTYATSGDVGFASFVLRSRRAGKIDDAATVSVTTRWIDSVTSGTRAAPFFIYMNLQNSHVPYLRPDSFPPRFGSGSTSFAIGFNSFPPDSAAAVRDIYANSLAYVDAQISRLIARLRARGILDSTVVIISGDHGQAFYEHGFAAQGFLPFAELARTPIIVRAPGLSPGLDPRPAQPVDIAPTVLSLLGLPPHPAFQGVDLTAPTFQPDRPLFTVVQTPMAMGYSVRRGRDALILDSRSGRVALYDDLRDPGETRDLSPALPARRDSLLRMLDMWRRVQIEYYTRGGDQAQWYPPVLRFGVEFQRAEGEPRQAGARSRELESTAPRENGERSDMRAAGPTALTTDQQ